MLAALLRELLEQQLERFMDEVDVVSVGGVLDLEFPVAVSRPVRRIAQIDLAVRRVIELQVDIASRRSQRSRSPGPCEPKLAKIRPRYDSTRGTGCRPRSAWSK